MLMEVFQKIIQNFNGKSDWLPEIYQIGIRNPQGLTLSPFDKKIYMSNHGAKVVIGFEVKKGENYGWKILGWGGQKLFWYSNWSKMETRFYKSNTLLGTFNCNKCNNYLQR